MKRTQKKDLMVIFVCSVLLFGLGSLSGSMQHEMKRDEIENNNEVELIQKTHTFMSRFSIAFEIGSTTIEINIVSGNKVFFRDHALNYSITIVFNDNLVLIDPLNDKVYYFLLVVIEPRTYNITDLEIHFEAMDQLSDWDVYFFTETNEIMVIIELNYCTILENWNTICKFIYIL